MVNVRMGQICTKGTHLREGSFMHQSKKKINKKETEYKKKTKKKPNKINKKYY